MCKFQHSFILAYANYTTSHSSPLSDSFQITNIADTPFNGAKVIRLKRTNLWDRYKSLFKAQETTVWHARRDEEVGGKEVKLVVPVNRMVKEMFWMKRMDDVGDEWAMKHASDILFVDYEECKASSDLCRSEMLKFLGVDDKGSSDTGITAFAKGNDPLEGIDNREEVAEALGANGFGSFIGRSDHTQLQLLIYETESLDEISSAARHVRLADAMRGINVTVIGQDMEHKGFGTKYAAAAKGMPVVSCCIIPYVLHACIHCSFISNLTLSSLVSCIISFGDDASR